jgi:hypothetical protein
MTGLRLELNNSDAYVDYIEQHLAPVATELHRITNELLSPGATSSEEWAMDMVSSKALSATFSRLDRRLDESAKHVTFDGGEYFSLPPELLRAKQLKIQLTAVVYVKRLGTATFRLVREDGMAIDNSEFETADVMPTTRVCILPFGDQPGCISSDKQRYFIEGRATKGAFPVCRRLSLSFVYI